MFHCPRCSSSTEGCRRCGRPLCLEHSPTPGQACNDCELAYFESRDRLPLLAWFAVGFALPVLAFLFVAPEIHRAFPAQVGGARAFTTGYPVLDAAIMTAVLAVFCGNALVAIRRWVHRRNFTDDAAIARLATSPYR